MEKCVAVFAGNSCAKEKEPFYFNLAYESGRLLAEAGFCIATGAGHGLMEQAARGAREAGGKTIGVGLSVINGVATSQPPYISEYSAFEKLGPRQDKLISLGDAFVALPGGIGTVFEAMEIIALKRLQELPQNKPMVFLGDYYEPVAAFVRHIIAEGFLEPEASSFYYFTPSAEAAVKYIKENI